MNERRYAMTRIRAGDYVFPSNDGGTLWRIYRYHENGSLMHVYNDGTHKTIRGNFWGAARFDGTLDEADRLIQQDPGSFLDWQRWTHTDSLLPTRAAAVESALRIPKGGNET